MWIAQVQTPSVTVPSFTVPTILVTLFIAILIGLLAQLIVGYTHIGFLGHILVGIIGAFAGAWLAAWLLLPNILLIDGVRVFLYHLNVHSKTSGCWLFENVEQVFLQFTCREFRKIGGRVLVAF